MATFIRLATDAAQRLLARSREVTQANRDADAERRRRAALTTNATTAATQATPVARVGGLLDHPSRYIPRPTAFSTLTLAAAVWSEERVGEVITLTVRNAANTASTTYTFTRPTIPVPEDALFPGANGSGIISGPTPPDLGVSPDIIIEPDPIPSPSSGSYTFAEEQFDTDYRRHSTAFALPLSKDSCLFVYHFRQVGIGYHVQIQTDVDWTYGVLDSANVGGLDHTLVGYTRTTSVTFTNDALNANAYITKCYLVTPSTVRELDTPAPLQAVITEFSVIPESYPTSLYVLGDYEASGSATHELVVSGLSVSSTPVTTGFANTNYSVRDFNDPDAESINDYFEAFPLLLCYGIGRFDTSDHRGTSLQATQVSSPAVYTFFSTIDSTLLDDYAAYFAPGGPYTTNALYSTVASLLPTTPTPPYFIGPNLLNGGSGELQGVADFEIRFDRALATPTSALTAVTSLSAYAPSRELVTFRGVTSAQRIAYAWDWGSPAYCRSQLLALGFTPADLTP